MIQSKSRMLIDLNEGSTQSGGIGLWKKSKLKTLIPVTMMVVNVCPI